MTSQEKRAAIEAAFAFRDRQCWCGSGARRVERLDARGIFLCYACDQCWPQKRLGYRPEVLTDPSYETYEPVEDES